MRILWKIFTLADLGGTPQPVDSPLYGPKFSQFWCSILDNFAKSLPLPNLEGRCPLPYRKSRISPSSSISSCATSQTRKYCGFLRNSFVAKKLGTGTIDKNMSSNTKRHHLIYGFDFYCICSPSQTYQKVSKQEIVEMPKYVAIYVIYVTSFTCLSWHLLTLKYYIAFQI